MKLGELCERADIVCRREFYGIEIDGVYTSSSAVRERGLFICIEGLHKDGHLYADLAAERGAVALVANEGAPLPSCVDMPVIRVSCTREACARIYAAYYGNPQKKMKIIGVTGTNGKTTVARMLFHILKQSGIKCGIIGTVGCESVSGKIDIRSSDSLANMTTPDPEELYKILSVMEKDGVEYVVMEVTSHALALKKTAPIDFEFGIFTNLTEEHLDFHKNMNEYFEVKASMFSRCRYSVINYDDPYGKALSQRICGKVMGCSAQGKICEYSAYDIRYDGPSGIEYKLFSPMARLRVRCAIPGNFTVMNSLEAVACALEMGLSATDIRRALVSLSGVDGRLESVELGERPRFSVFIDYAHTPDALANLLATARGFKKPDSRIILLFGCGGDRDRSKRKLMGQIASRMADFVIVTSDNSRSEKAEDIISEILIGMDKEKPYAVIPDRREAIIYAVRYAKERDIILLAGKGHENYEIDSEGKKPFCEKEIVRDTYFSRFSED